MSRKNATSSPVVWEGECYFSQRQEVTGQEARAASPQQMEHLVARKVAESSYRRYAETSGIADYLDHAKRRPGRPSYAASAQRTPPSGSVISRVMPRCIRR